jgi:hypothetical protein
LLSRFPALSWSFPTASLRLASALSSTPHAACRFPSTLPWPFYWRFAVRAWALGAPQNQAVALRKLVASAICKSSVLTYATLYVLVPHPPRPSSFPLRWRPGKIRR